MTEAEWLASESPETMLRRLQFWNAGTGEAEVRSHPAWHDERRLRLFGEACSWASGCSADVVDDVSRRRVLDATVPEWARRWTESVPNTASGSVPQTVKAAILRDIVGNPFRPWVRELDESSPGSVVWRGKILSVGMARGEGVSVLRRAWLTPDVLVLAEAAYSERQPDGTLDPLRLAILADALEEAGCPTEETVVEQYEYCNAFMYGCEEFDAMDTCTHKVKGERRIRRANFLLNHLRSPGPHWRGCWAIDLVLGKS